MPPKKGPQPKGKAGPSKLVNNTTTTTGSKEPIDRNQLVTSQTSPLIVKKAFGKLCQLFRALIADIDQPLPPRVKAEILDKAGFESLSTRLSHAVTKYVLFICQEGTISTIESQTQLLLNIIRSVCVAIRAKLKDAGITLQISLAETGTAILELLTNLMNDLSNQISTEWKKSLDSNGKFQSPLNTDDKQIVMVTAQVWAACRKLAEMPLTDKEAISLQANNYLAMMQDAYKEIKQVKEGEHEFPLDDDDVEGEVDQNNDENTQDVPLLVSGPDLPDTVTNTDTTTTTTSKISSEDVPEEEQNSDDKTEQVESVVENNNDTATDTNTNDDKTTNDTPTAADNMKEFEQDLDYTPNELAKSEFIWLTHAKSIISYSNSIVSTFVTKILPSMQHPSSVNRQIDPKVPQNDSNLIDLKVPGSLNQQKQWVITLERRLKDIEKITYYTDMLCQHLYTPQNIPLASKYAWFILSKISRLLLWLDLYFKNNWFKNVMNTQGGGMVFLSENDTSITYEKQQCTQKERDGVYVQHSWWNDMLVNPSLRPIVIAKNNEYVEQKKLNQQYNRIHEFDNINKTAKLGLISQWKWINFQRKELFLLMYTKQNKDGINLFLEHFKLQSYRFPIPQSIIDENNNNNKNNTPTDPLDIQPLYKYTEDNLFDDKEDLPPDEDDEDIDDEDYDEDDLFDDDYGLFSDESD